MNLGNRIKARSDELGISGAELARRVGLKQPTISALMSGKSRSSSHLHLIARALETTVEYLLGETDDPSPAAEVKDRQLGYRGPPVEASPTVELQEIDLAYGMGGTFLDDIPVKAETMRFTRDWLRNFTNSPPEHLFFARGAGDSMAPTILDSDMVLVDRSQDTPRMGDQIWAIAFGGVGMIKRLRPHPDGTVRILSDNPQVPDDRAADGEMFIIGRVVAVVRKV